MPNSMTVPTCPLCHTVDVTVTLETLATGAGWHCTMCGQRWDADRLATVDEAFAEPAPSASAGPSSAEQLSMRFSGCFVAC